jgi:hypothetical protein
VDTRISPEPRVALRPLLATLRDDLLAALRDVAPIIVVVTFFQLVVIRQPLPDLGGIAVGGGVVVVGLALFVRGLEMALFPLGELMAIGLARRGSLAWLSLFAFALGFSTTVAEPALLAIADEAADVAAADGLIASTAVARADYALGLRLTVALSVGTAIVIGVIRIIRGWSVLWLIVAGYVGVVLMTMVAPTDVVGIAYDSGGVTTSTVTVPLVTALGVGLASAVKGRSPLVDGFGLIAFASLTPMIFVMAYGTLA